MKRRPVARACARTTPDPAKGSNTESPGSVVNSTIRSTREDGKGQKWRNSLFDQIPCTGIGKVQMLDGTLPSGLYRSGYLTHHSFRLSGSFIRSTWYLKAGVFAKNRMYSKIRRNCPRP